MEDRLFKERYLLFLATFILVACLGYFFAITFLTISPSGIKYADIILGALIGAGFTGLLNFFWGTSKGSADKSETIAKQIENAADIAVLEEKKE